MSDRVDISADEVERLYRRGGFPGGVGGGHLQPHPGPDPGAGRDGVEGKKRAGAIPERRPPRGKRVKKEVAKLGSTLKSLPLPVWRCRVCGYLCARDGPPEVCPICKAKKE